MKTLGQYIRDARDEKDISLREFAKKIDCSPAFLSDIELGKRNPSEDVFTKIAKALSVSASELKKYDTRPPTEGIRKLSISDPGIAFAFRTLIDKNVTSGQLLDFAKKLNNQKKPGKSNEKSAR